MRRISLRYRIITFTILAFVLILSCFSFFYYQNKTQLLSQQLHEQNKDLIDKVIALKQSNLLRINNNSYVAFLQNAETKAELESFSNTASNKLGVKKKLDTFLVNNKEVSSVAAYFPSDNLVLTTQAGHSFTFSHYFDFQLYLEASKSNKSISPLRSMRLQNGSYEPVISVVAHVKDRTYKNMIAVNVSTEKLYQEIYQTLSIDDSLSLLVVKQDGSLLFSSAETEHEFLADYLANPNKTYKDRIVTQYYSPHEELTYIAELTYTAAPTALNREFTLLFLVALAVLAIIILYFYHQLFKPLDTILAFAKDENKTHSTKDELTLLGEILLDLKHENSRVSTENLEFKTLYRERMLLNLLLSSHYLPAEIESQITRYDVPIPLHDYVALVLALHNYSSKTLFEVQALVQKQFGAYTVTILEKQTHLCIALHIPSFAGETTMEEIYQLSASMMKLIYAHYQDGFLGIGPHVETLTDIRSSYQVALESLDYTKSLNTAIVRYQDLASRISDIFYTHTPKQEGELLQALKLRDIGLCHQVIDSLFSALLSESLPINGDVNSVLHMLVLTISNYALRETKLESISELSARSLDKIIESRFLDQSIIYLKDYTEKIILLFSEESQNQVVYQIVNYIGEHFAENMQLLDLEEKFGLNRYYIGQLIKDFIGISFNDYLNQLRIEKAAVLLTTTSASVKQISGELGYQYPYYFSKIFKQEKGVSPNEYRQAANPTQP